jgi:hypothetical protein
MAATTGPSMGLVGGGIKPQPERLSAWLERTDAHIGVPREGTAFEVCLWSKLSINWVEEALGGLNYQASEGQAKQDKALETL